MCACLDSHGGASCEQWEEQAASMLSSYQLQIQVIEGMFEEMQEQLGNSRDVCHMQMSSKRNYIIQTNLVLTIANLALLNCTLASGFFGGCLALHAHWAGCGHAHGPGRGAEQGIARQDFSHVS